MGKIAFLRVEIERLTKLIIEYEKDLEEIRRLQVELKACHPELNENAIRPSDEYDLTDSGNWAGARWAEGDKCFTEMKYGFHMSLDQIEVLEREVADAITKIMELTAIARRTIEEYEAEITRLLVECHSEKTAC